MRGLGGRPDLALPRVATRLVTLPSGIPARFHLLAGKQIGGEARDGVLEALSATGARLRTGDAVEELANLKLALGGVPGGDRATCCAKVVESDGEGLLLRFTTRSPEAASRLAEALAAAGGAGEPPAEPSPARRGGGGRGSQG